MDGGEGKKSGFLVPTSLSGVAKIALPRLYLDLWGMEYRELT